MADLTELSSFQFFYGLMLNILGNFALYTKPTYSLLLTWDSVLNLCEPWHADFIFTICI